jgi:hypothetical protein
VYSIVSDRRPCNYVHATEITPTMKLQMSIYGCGLQSNCGWLETWRTTIQYYKWKVISPYLNLNYLYDGTCTSARYVGYLNLNQTFHGTRNSAGNFAVPVLLLSILGIHSWTRYFPVSGIQPEILLYLNLNHIFHVTETRPHMSQYLKLSHLFSGTWTSAGYLTPC